MPDSEGSLHIDSDWKKQAQEEKRKLAEQEKQAPKPETPPAPGPGGAARPAGRGTREIPPANFASIVQSLATQALFYLGDLAPRGGEPILDLDMAKHHIDSLSVLEEKTANNLTPEEKRVIDSALYETRMRYISVASQFVGEVARRACML